MSSKIYIVGMGPGTGDMMTPQADHALCGSDVIVFHYSRSRQSDESLYV